MSGVNTFLLMVLLILAVVGLSRGWFSVTGGREPGNNKVDVNFVMDPDKVKTDMEAVKEKAEHFTGATISHAPEQTPPPSDTITIPKKY